MALNRRKYLVLDSRVIDATEDVVLRVGTSTKHPANPMFGEDKPWELRYDNLYPNAIFDEDDQLFKCWYNPFIVDTATAGTPPRTTGVHCLHEGTEPAPGDGTLLRRVEGWGFVGKAEFGSG